MNFSSHLMKINDTANNHRFMAKKDKCNFFENESYIDTTTYYLKRL